MKPSLNSRTRALAVRPLVVALGLAAIGYRSRRKSQLAATTSAL